jgi:hypothetical protein
MKQLQPIAMSDPTIVTLAYELNAVAHTFAAEAGRLSNGDKMTNGENPDVNVELVRQLHAMIEQFRSATLALRYARHSGQLPPKIRKDYSH